jgi:hypothetical protein
LCKAMDVSQYTAAGALWHHCATVVTHSAPLLLCFDRGSPLRMRTNAMPMSTLRTGCRTLWDAMPCGY